MFDVQVIRHRRSPQVPDDVLDSIARYYRRVTTTASPMGRLVAVVMLTLAVSLVVQAFQDKAPVWVSVVSFVAAATGVGLAGGRVFGAARRLGTRGDPPDVQSALARGILRDHLVCFAAMATLLAVQLAAA